MSFKHHDTCTYKNALLYHQSSPHETVSDYIYPDNILCITEIMKDSYAYIIMCL